MHNSQPLSGPVFDQGACYHILLRGRLDASWSEDLGGMTVTAVTEPGLEPAAEPVTLLAGWVLDQAALYGLLQYTYNLGLTILAVRRIDGTILD
jgi:hypothetical protein